MRQPVSIIKQPSSKARRLMKHRKHNPAWEHIKLYAWVILIIEVLIFCIALAVGRSTGYLYAFKVYFWLGLLVAVVFLSVLMLNLLGIATLSSVTRLRDLFPKKVARQKNRFYIMTVVHYKHWTGPVYFNMIRPFHHLVVRRMALAGLKGNG